jgi:uncharacterized protein (AIM24 family)
MRDGGTVTIQHKIRGEDMQMVVCQLGPDQTIYAEAGKFLFKTANVSMETRLSKPSGDGAAVADAGDGGGGAGGAAGGGGFLKKALQTGMEMGKRTLAGESLAFQYYRAAGSGLVAFAGVLPGQMQAIELDGTGRWLAEKDAFVCAESTVDFDIAFSGFKAGRKGGEGFVLERFSGVGTLIIAGAGNSIELNPAKYGGKLQVDTGCVVAFEDTIRYAVERVGGLNLQTAMTAMLGGEGLNLATLEGDGRVILQSMTYEGMTQALTKHLGNANRNERGGLGGLLGGGTNA